MTAIVIDMGTVTGPTVNGVALRTFREMQTPAISQEALATLVGISQSHLSKIESGQKPNPNPRVTAAIALQLNIPIAAITSRREPCPECATAQVAA